MKVAIALVLLATFTPAAQKKVLVYTKNGKGYVHENIATSVDAIRTLGAQNGFVVDASDDPKVFTPENLKQYKAIVFSNSNNEGFESDAQREAFKKYVQAGGGVVGIHIATGTERQWPYFAAVMGGRFVRHPKLQRFTVTVKDRTHPATKVLTSDIRVGRRVLRLRPDKSEHQGTPHHRSLEDRRSETNRNACGVSAVLVQHVRWRASVLHRAGP